MRAIPFLLFAALLPAQEPLQDALSLIAAAERKLARQAPDEDTTLLLWQIEEQLAATARSPERDAALAKVQALLPKADPATADRIKTRGDVAKKLIEVAQLYRQRKWYGVAEDRLRAALRFDEAAAQKELQAMAAARAREPGYRPPAKEEPPAPEGALIPRLQMPNKGGEWTVDGEELVAPADSKKDKSFWSMSTMKHGDGELAVEIKITENKGLASLMFGTVSVKDHFLAILERVAADQWALRCDSFAESGQVGSKKVMGRLPPSDDGWHRLEVLVRDKSAEVSVDGGALKLQADLVRTAHGTVGFTIYGLDEKTPIRFRNLAIGPLPEKVDATADRAKAQTELDTSLQTAVAEGEKLLAEKQAEAGVLTLQRARAEARRLEAAKRDKLDAAIEKLLSKGDPVHAKHKKAAQEAGALLAGLVARYEAAGFPACALAGAREAAVFDAAHAALVPRCEGTIAARDGSLTDVRAMELAAPAVDNAFLVTAFRRSRYLNANTRPWVVDGNGIRCEQLGGGEQSVLLSQDLPAVAGSFAVHVRLARPGAICGFAFDALGNSDYGVAALQRSADKLTLVVRRYLRGKWQTFGRLTVPVPAWRLAGWFELRLEELPDQVKVSVADIEMVVERSKLGKIGPLGFVAEVAGAGPVDVEVRGLRKLEPVK